MGLFPQRYAWDSVTDHTHFDVDGPNIVPLFDRVESINRSNNMDRISTFCVFMNIRKEAVPTK